MRTFKKTNLRAWQQSALDKFLASKPQDFMAVATPGAGKTTFALRIATELMEDRTVERVIVVVPTEHLKTQWSSACLLYTSPSPRDLSTSRMPSSA